MPAEFELVNPEQPIATLNKGAKLEMGIRIGVGRGYVSADRNKKAEDPIGVITVDSLFSPVTRCTYVVENTRVGQRTDYDKLTLEVETNGAIDPNDAVARAGHIINEHMAVFTEQATTTLPEEGIFAAVVDETDSVHGDVHRRSGSFGPLVQLPEEAGHQLRRPARGVQRGRPAQHP